MRSSVLRYGPPPTSSRKAPGAARSTSGQTRMSMSCPLRGTSRETHTTTGRSPRPSAARISAPPAPGRNTSVSTPGVSRTSFSGGIGPESRSKV